MNEHRRPKIFPNKMAAPPETNGLMRSYEGIMAVSNLLISPYIRWGRGVGRMARMTRSFVVGAMFSWDIIQS